MAAGKDGPRHTGVVPGRTNRDRVLGQTAPGKYHCTLERHERRRAWSHEPEGPRQAPSIRPSQPLPIQKPQGKTERSHASYGFGVAWQVGRHRRLWIRREDISEQSWEPPIRLHSFNYELNSDLSRCSRLTKESDRLCWLDGNETWSGMPDCSGPWGDRRKVVAARPSRPVAEGPATLSGARSRA
jgi:hypothetical protein